MKQKSFSSIEIRSVLLSLLKQVNHGVFSYFWTDCSSVFRCPFIDVYPVTTVRPYKRPV